LAYLLVGRVIKDGGFQLHVLFKLDKRLDVTDSTTFDIMEGESRYHPNVQRPDNYLAAKNYVREEYKENIKQAKEAGLLIEEWPEDFIRNDGRQKRPAAFDEDEFKEVVKRARNYREFIDILREKNPLVLAENFNNIYAISNICFPP
jgi:hypothetical protein